jgi:hypothetical protein
MYKDTDPFPDFDARPEAELAPNSDDDDWPEDLPKEHYELVDRTIGVINKLRKIFRGDFGPYNPYLRCRARFQFEQARLLRLQPYSEGYAELERLERIYHRENRKLDHPDDYITRSRKLDDWCVL